MTARAPVEAERNMMAINKELAAQVRDKLLAVPESYDQTRYAKKAQTPCGTVACIAGHTLLVAGYCTVAELHNRRRRDPETGAIVQFNIHDEAARLLGLDDRAANALFNMVADGWHYKDEFAEAATQEQEAYVAAKQLNYLIRTGKVT